MSDGDEQLMNGDMRLVRTGRWGGWVPHLGWDGVLGMDEDGPFFGVPHPVIKRWEVAGTLDGGGEEGGKMSHRHSLQVP